MSNRVFVQACGRKKPYPSKAAAIGSQHKNNTKIRAYKCQFCGQWHLTTTTRRPVQ